MAPHEDGRPGEPPPAEGLPQGAGLAGLGGGREEGREGPTLATESSAGGSSRSVQGSCERGSRIATAA